MLKNNSFFVKTVEDVQKYRNNRIEKKLIGEETICVRNFVGYINENWVSQY